MDASFQTLDVKAAERNFAQLHEQVVRGTGRIEITRNEPTDGTADGADVCVIISKAELQSLERALEILSNTEDVRAMRVMLTRIVAMCVSAEPDDAPRLADVTTALMTGTQH